MELPEGVRRAVRTTRILERLNRKLGRRTNVADVFPYDGSVMRPAGSFLIEEDARRRQKRKLYTPPAVVETEVRVPCLARIARQQVELRKTAYKNRDYKFTHRLGLDPTMAYLGNETPATLSHKRSNTLPGCLNIAR